MTAAMLRTIAMLNMLAAAPFVLRAAEAPLPDVPTLLRSVEQNQDALDRVREQYTFREQLRTITLDGKGRVKKTEDVVRYVFFVHGHSIETVVSRNGRPLSADELKKEQDHATKEAVKYAAQPYQRDKDEVSVTRLLAIARFSHPRRVIENGRPVIAIDFVGDPHAKSEKRAEAAIKHMSGTVWIDETAREVRRLEAKVDDPVRIGFGVLATVNPGTRFAFEQALINNEVWLPTSLTGKFDAKAALLIGFHIQLQSRFDEYKKYQASATEATQRPSAK